MVVGRRIKALRQSLGLSQRQLAGQEMTREFISLVESGKCQPSLETLRIIAERLGKPIEYFLNDATPEDRLDLPAALLQSARHDMEQATGEGPDAAYRKLLQVIRLCSVLENTTLEAQARVLLIRCLFRQDRFADILEEADRAIECCRHLDDPRALADLYRCVGHSCFALDEFSRARRAYEKALLYSSGHKSMVSLRTEVELLLGSTLYRLGLYDDAVRCYTGVYEECTLVGDLKMAGEAAMGLGLIFTRRSQLALAREWALKSVKALSEPESPSGVQARHNLAITEAAMGNVETAYTIYQTCLETYRKLGRPEREASVMEELADYWHRKGDLTRAESICWEALDLLEIRDSGVLRGRLLRKLGLLAAQQGNIKTARSYLRMGLQIFRAVKAASEAADVQADLDRIVHADKDCEA